MSAVLSACVCHLVRLANYTNICISKQFYYFNICILWKKLYRDKALPTVSKERLESLFLSQ